ncbi:LPXTG cell wall anchor domain-containing protein [Streptomyces somaliensis]|uniref:SCO1860 family LAETG-anchored protein n=1 Tax=Streptomyces somaliensis TaxID=78355 RepID=UPI0034E95AA3|nr:LPXTG cell wall anchor domain-containing protein [Streptomyces somaliensis]MCP9973347.1 LPXTG cell wall anchor domain-containing protein [Streptomyces somaliensis]
MNSSTFRTHATAVAATAAAVAVLGTVTAPAALAAPAAPSAHATVLRTGLDVSLLNGGARVPVNASLNEVKAPATADRTSLSVRVDGVDENRPVQMLRADVASAKATSDASSAEGSVKLVGARVHVPGLPLLSVVEAEQVTARAVCRAGSAPTAEANLLGTVTALGKRVTLTPGQRSTVQVQGVGEVVLDLSRRTTTSTSAAATALELKVAVNPLNLNVSKVTGTVTLAEAGCKMPAAAPGAPSAPAPTPSQGTGAPDPSNPSATPAPSRPSAAPDPSDTGAASDPSAAPGDGNDPSPAGGDAPADGGNLAETGGSSSTPYLVAGAAALLVVGAVALKYARRARS